MRQRVISSVAIVAIALLPILLGGPVFAVLMIALATIGFSEFTRLARGLGATDLPGGLLGYAVIIALGLTALTGATLAIAVGIVALAVFAPLVVALLHASNPSAVTGASLIVTGTLYLGIPVFAAVSLRGAPGSLDQQWLLNLTDLAAVSWNATPRGLAWTALVVFTIWAGDSAAYLGGRSLGRHPLAPRISPKKTIEGALAGLAGSAVTSLLCVSLFGLELPVAGSLALGVGLGATGQIGDLIESLLKRQAGVKDSGALIPGHGGMLDRIDALLLVFPVAWIAISFMDGSLP